MEHWSILSDIAKYVQHDKDQRTFHDLNVNALDYRNHKKLCAKLKEEERETLDMDFSDSPHKLKRKYLDMY